MVLGKESKVQLNSTKKILKENSCEMMQDSFTLGTKEVMNT